MRLQNVEKQPIQFGRELPCHCEGFPYSLYYADGDDINFYLQPSTGSDVVTNGDFTSSLTDWTGAGWSVSSNVASGTGSLTQACLTVGNYYKVTLKGLGIELFSSTDTATVQLGTNNVGTIQSTGDVVFYGQCTGNTTLTIEAPASIVMSIDEVVVNPLVGVTDEVFFKDENGGLSGVTGFGSGVFNNGYVSFFRTETPPDGCFSLCVVNGDGVEEAEDPTFADSGQWTVDNPIGATVTFNAPGIEIATLAAGDVKVTQNQTFQVSGDCYIDYEVNFNLDGGASFGSYGVTLELSGSQTYSEILPWNTGGGNVTGRILNVEPGTYTLSIIYTSTGASSAQITTEDISLSVHCCYLESNEFVPNIDECTKLITGSFNSDGLRFGWFQQADFDLSMRLPASIYKLTGENNSEFTQGYDGVYKRRYSEPIINYAMDFEPIHDFGREALFYILNMSNLVIDSDRYVYRDESYEPINDGVSCDEGVSIQITPETQNSQSKYC